MANIKVDPDVLEQKAKDIRSYKQQHDEAINKLNSLVSALDGEWVGTAKNNYVNSSNEFKSSFNSFSEKIEALAVQLEKKAAEYRAADNQ